MNAIHHDITTLTEAANSKSTTAPFSVLGTTQPLAELPLAQLELVGGGSGATSIY